MQVNRIVKVSNKLLLLIIAVVSLNIISSRLFTRCDLTEGKVYSISEGSKNLLKKLKEPIEIKFYFSRSLKTIPVIKTYGSRVEEVLLEYARYGKEKIKLEILDPMPDTDVEEWAKKYGVRATPLPNGNEMYFGLVFLKGSKEIVIPYLDFQKEGKLEYEISEAIVQVTRVKKPKILLYSSLPIMGKGNMMMGPEGYKEPWFLVQGLKKHFEVESVDQNTIEIPLDVDLLLIIHPKKDVSDQLQYAIDQFALRGGKIIVAVDPFSRVDLSSMNRMAMLQGGGSPSSHLERLFASWGISFNSNQIVGDLTHPTLIGVGQGTSLNYPFFVSLKEVNVSRSHVITSDLKNILFAEGGAIEKKKGSLFSFTPLITTSEDSGVVSNQMASFSTPNDLTQSLKSDGKKRVLAAIVSGKFTSAFPDGPPKTTKKEEGKDNKEQTPSQAHIKKAKKEGTIFVIGDVDFMADDNSVRKFSSFGRQVFAKMINDNLTFLLNTVEFLSGHNDLIKIRSKSTFIRPFDTVQALRARAEKKWQKVVETLNEKISDVQKKLMSLQKERSDDNIFTLSEDQQEEIRHFRQEEAKVSKKLREVRKGVREDVNALGRVIVGMNMLIMPIIVSIIGFLLFRRRIQKSKIKE